MTTDCHWNCVHQIVYITANNNLRKKVKNNIFASTCNVLEEKVKAKLTFVLLRMTSTYLGMYFRRINSRASTCTFWRALEWTFFMWFSSYIQRSKIFCCYLRDSFRFMFLSSLIDIYAILIQIFLVKSTVLLSGFYLSLQAANHKQ